MAASRWAQFCEREASHCFCCWRVVAGSGADQVKRERPDGLGWVGCLAVGLVDEGLVGVDEVGCVAVVVPNVLLFPDHSAGCWCGIGACQD